MTSRERMRKTLEYARPDRVPRQLWLLPYATDHYPGAVDRIHHDFPDDITNPPEVYSTPPHTEGDPYTPGFYRDEWGCVFENHQPGYIGEVKEPLLRDWNDTGKIRTPDELLTLDVAAVNDYCRNTDTFVIPGCFARPFERLQFIRTTEKLFCDLMDQPPELFALIGRIHAFYIKQLELWAKTDVDALFFMDDWGAQRSLLISPDLWRSIFKPLYRDYITIAHDHGKYCFMHSDGYIIDIIPDLIGLGLDALNSQIFCMGADKLGERFRGKLTFWGEIDRQHILPYASPDEVSAAVRNVREALYCDGGAIAQCEFGPGARPENVYRVFETWNEPG
ncbi:methyltransferase [bacterium]|nr:methyltransferase [bacterium]